MTDIQRIKNLGPVCEELLREIGIKTAEEVAELGAVDVYVKLKRAFPRRVNLLFLYAIWTGLQGKQFNDISPKQKEELKAEAIKKLTDSKP